MKLRSLVAVFALFAAASWTSAQTPQADMKSLYEQIQAKLNAKQTSATDLASELKAFDELVEKYKDQKTDEVAQISFMRALLYLQVLEQKEKALEMFKQIKTDFPGTRAAANMDGLLAKLAQQEKAEAAKSELVGKAAPELHFKWATREGLKTLSELKGKVVVLDFWATWCGPCIRSFPQIREVTERFKDAEVVVLGVTSLQGRVVNLEAQPIDTKGDPAKEMALMKDFIKAKDITWTIAFSEENVFNEAYGVTGIPHMAIVAPDGTVRFNGIHPSEPGTIGKIDALLKEFKLTVPPVAKK